MKALLAVLAALLSAVASWADDLQPVTFSQAVKEYNSFWSSDSINPGNHEVWKLYICGELIPNGNYNHEKEIFVARLAPGTPYVVYLSINQLYNFLQPIPKVGDVIAVEGRIVNHFYSTIQGAVKTRRIPVLSMYVEDAAGLPFEPAAAAAILTPEPRPILTAGPTPGGVALLAREVPPTSVATVPSPGAAGAH